MLRSRPGVSGADLLAARDGEAYTYLVESEPGVDIRKNLFYSLAEKGWPLVGMEASGMSLEDIFIAIVDQTGAKKTRYERRGATRRARGAAEQDMARSILEKTEKKTGGEYSALFGEDEESDR